MRTTVADISRNLVFRGPHRADLDLPSYKASRMDAQPADRVCKTAEIQRPHEQVNLVSRETLPLAEQRPPPPQSLCIHRGLREQDLDGLQTGISAKAPEGRR